MSNGMRAMLGGGAIALALAAAGCGGAGGGGAAAKWNQTDACKTLDAAGVAAATGLQVKSAELASSHSASDGGASMSQCSYMLANDAVASLTTRYTPDDEMTDAQMQEMATAGGTMTGFEPVDGLGMKAFWNPKAGMLQVFPDRRSWVATAYRAAMTLPGTPAAPGPDPKVVTLAMAKKVL